MVRELKDVETVEETPGQQLETDRASLYNRSKHVINVVIEFISVPQVYCPEIVPVKTSLNTPTPSPHSQ